MAILMVTAVSCKTITKSVERTDTVYVARIIADSSRTASVNRIYIHDSIHVKESADTVVIEKYRTQNQLRVDTVLKFIERIDTVYQYKTNTVDRTTERQPSLWDRIRKSIGGIVIIGTLLLLAVIYIKKKAGN